MENFVIAGKAKTVFRLIELKAKLEKAAEAQKKTKKKQFAERVMTAMVIATAINVYIVGGPTLAQIAYL